MPESISFNQGIPQNFIYIDNHTETTNLVCTLLNDFFNLAQSHRAAQIPADNADESVSFYYFVN